MKLEEGMWRVLVADLEIERDELQDQLAAALACQERIDQITSILETLSSGPDASYVLVLEDDSEPGA